MRCLPLALAGLALAACTPDNGPTMRPGDDCLRCHGGATPGSTTEGLPVHHATPWSLAGTAYPSLDSGANAGIEGVDIQVTDARGFTFTLHSNLAGNFYSAETVAFPLHVCASRNGLARCMESPSPHGACNYCHALPPLGDAPGRITAP
jgi:hypothetical protein